MPIKSNLLIRLCTETGRIMTLLDCCPTWRWAKVLVTHSLPGRVATFARTTLNIASHASFVQHNLVNFLIMSVSWAQTCTTEHSHWSRVWNRCGNLLFNYWIQMFCRPGNNGVDAVSTGHRRRSWRENDKIGAKNDAHLTIWINSSTSSAESLPFLEDGSVKDLVGSSCAISFYWVVFKLCNDY